MAPFLSCPSSALTPSADSSTVQQSPNLFVWHLKPYIIRLQMLFVLQTHWPSYSCSKWAPPCSLLSSRLLFLPRMLFSKSCMFNFPSFKVYLKADLLSPSSPPHFICTCLEALGTFYLALWSLEYIDASRAGGRKRGKRERLKWDISEIFTIFYFQFYHHLFLFKLGCW